VGYWGTRTKNVGLYRRVVLDTSCAGSWNGMKCSATGIIEHVQTGGQAQCIGYRATETLAYQVMGVYGVGVDRRSALNVHSRVVGHYHCVGHPQDLGGAHPPHVSERSGQGYGIRRRDCAWNECRFLHLNPPF